jgi:hypothetical protein
MQGGQSRAQQDELVTKVDLIITRPGAVFLLCKMGPTQQGVVWMTQDFVCRQLLV